MILDLLQAVFPEDQGWVHEPFFAGPYVHKGYWTVYFDYGYEDGCDPDPDWIARVRVLSRGATLGVSDLSCKEPLPHLSQALERAQERIVQTLGNSSPRMNLDLLLGMIDELLSMRVQLHGFIFRTLKDP